MSRNQTVKTHIVRVKLTSNLTLHINVDRVWSTCVGHLYLCRLTINIYLTHACSE